MKNVPNGGKHIVIHNKFYTYIAAGSKSPELLHTVFEATVIDKCGLTLPNYSHQFLEFPQSLSTLEKKRRKKSPRLLNDAGFGRSFGRLCFLRISAWGCVEGLEMMDLGRCW
jgi:hypothetical protein